jgi:hypothetical protein
MEKVTCAYCGREISAEPVAPSEGETPVFREGRYYHLECWGRARRERGQTLREAEVQEALPYPWPPRPEVIH